MGDKTDGALFVMEQPKTFTWEVKVRVPLDGRYGLVRFVGTFPNMTDAERQELMSSGEGGLPKFTDLQVADKVLLAFDGVKQADGGMLACTPDNKALLLAQPRVAVAVVGTFMAVTRGVAEEKNA